jgi:SAM-dependent methyltransferase
MPGTGPFDRYVKEYESWFEKNRFAYESELEAVRLMIPGSGKGLEIGVGTGKFAVPLGITLGLEPSRCMGEIARQRGVSVLGGVAEALPVADGRFDFILMVTVLCFLNDVGKSLREIHRVLRPGGSIVIAFIDRESPLGREYEESKEDSRFYQDAYFLSAEEVASHLEAAGFVDLEFIQTIFRSHKEMNDIEPVREGHGEGVFVVVRAVRSNK